MNNHEFRINLKFKINHESEIQYEFKINRKFKIGHE